MKIEEFKKEKSRFINKCKKAKAVDGFLSKNEDIEKANFNGVYIIYKKSNGEVVYIGSAYTNKFKIKDRLHIHLKGHLSNATIVKYLVEKEGMDIEMAKKELREKYKFIAYPCESIEYKLMEEVKGLYNLKGMR